MLRLILIAALVFPVHSNSNVFAENGDLDTLIIPPKVVEMFVFTQERETLARGSSTELNDGGGMNPDEFRGNLKKYIKKARNKNVMLVITARNKYRKYAIQNKIKYRGIELQPTQYWHMSEGKIYWGVEFPVD